MSFLFGKKSTRKVTRLFFATDLHGSEKTFRKFINTAKFYQANVLVMGGDIIGKVMIPIIGEGAGHYRATLQGTVEHIETEEELKKLQERLGLLGFYFKIMEEDEYRAMQDDPNRVDAVFHDLARERLQAWIDLAETRLAGTGVKCYVTGGNDDYTDVLETLPHPGGSTQTIFNCEGDIVPIDDVHTMISLGWSTPTPWDTPRETNEEELGRMIAALTGQVPDMSRCVFNFHDPPIDSTLDTCPKLNWDTHPPEPIMQGGQVVLFGAGSQAVRTAIERHQPVLGLHGHIHESQGVARLGRTVCVNPGSEYGEGILRGCLINLSDGKVQDFQMTSG